MGIESVDAERQARVLIGGIVENGVIACPRNRDVLVAMTEAIAGLPLKLRQKLSIAVEELRKNRKKYVANTPADVHLTSEEKECSDVATIMRVDAVICRDDGFRSTVDSLTPASVEVIVLKDYGDSATETLRISLKNPAKPLDQMPAAERDDVVARFVRYARKATFADKMFGRKSDDTTFVKALRPFVLGVRYVHERWYAASPYTTIGTLEIEIITVAGMTPGGGMVDAKSAQSRIKDAIKRETGCGPLVQVKQDSDPSCFHGRYVECKRRCSLVEPGIDGLSDFLHHGGVARPVHVVPPNDAFAATLSQIRSLPEA